MRTTWRYHLASVLALLGLAAPGFGTTIKQTGVLSNFAIHQGRVCFTQADGSLTVLNLKTGEVIARTKERWQGRSLQVTEAGILLSCSSGTMLLNPSSLDLIWQVEKHYLSEMVKDRLILRDGSGLVECRQLGTGNVLWAYNLPGALDIVVEKGKILVFRSAVYDGPNCAPAVVLLDLETGKETLHRTTPPSTHYLAVYFDGERIYLPAGPYKGEHTPNITRYDKGRPSARFETLLIWDVNGKEIDSIPAPENLRSNRLRAYHEPFSLDGKFFIGHRAYSSPDAVPPSSSGLGELVPNRIPIDDPETVLTRFAVRDGWLTMKPADLLREHSIGRDRPITIRLESKHGQWTGTLPYLPAPGTLHTVGSTADRILLGSNLGHVECVDAQTGKSLWMYVFPTIRRVTSTSSWSKAPDRATMAEDYKRDNSKPMPESGMVLDGSAEPSHPMIIRDPSPSNPLTKPAP